jgi:hypothetical protein
MDFMDDTPGYDDQDDLGGSSAADIAQAIYGPESVTMDQSDAARVANQPFAREMNGRYPDFPYKNPPGILTPVEQAKVRALALVMGKMMRQVNLTTADPAHVSPTVWSEPVDESARVSIPAAAALPGVWQDVITLEIPKGRWARIEGYGYSVEDPAYTYDGGIQFRILVNGNPVPSLSTFTEQRGTPINPRKVFFLATSQQQIKFQARRAVAAAGAQDLVAVLTGWTWILRNTFEGTRAATTAY